MSTNEINDEDINYFLTTLKNVEGGYPRIRDLRRILGPRLNLFKINAILRYLERSKRLQTDLDGNVIWIREDNNKNANQISLAERANISKEFLDYFSINEKCRSEEGNAGIESEE